MKLPRTGPGPSRTTHHSPLTTHRRAAFTLIEMLLVIAIIATLVAMLLPAIFNAFRRANEAKNRSDIGQLGGSVQLFHSEFKKGYFPSRLVLCENEADYFSSPGVFKTVLHQDSYAYLKSLWPRLTFPVDWNGDGVQAPAGTEWWLEGDQCLVFFLGGIPVPPGTGTKGVQGFSTDPSRPAAPGGPRKGPFFEFQEARLVNIHPTTAPGFYSYQDPYRNSNGPAFSVYAYFSSYKTLNGYNRYYPVFNNSDCASLLPGGVWPYYEGGSGTTTPRYLNPSSFQIISAGADGVFAHGSPVIGYAAATGIWLFDPDALWTASTATDYARNHPVGKDDMANFYDSLIGTAQ